MALFHTRAALLARLGEKLRTALGETRLNYPRVSQPAMPLEGYSGKSNEKTDIGVYIHRL